jgi:hypothetical protein
MRTELMYVSVVEVLTASSYPRHVAFAERSLLLKNEVILVLKLIVCLSGVCRSGNTAHAIVLIRVRSEFPRLLRSFVSAFKRYVNHR